MVPGIQLKLSKSYTSHSYKKSRLISGKCFSRSGELYAKKLKKEKPGAAINFDTNIRKAASQRQF
jgi:hypothetical protein